MSSRSHARLQTFYEGDSTQRVFVGAVLLQRAGGVKLFEATLELMREVAVSRHKMKVLEKGVSLRDAAVGPMQVADEFRACKKII